MKQPFVRVLGSADWHQTKYNDHSCYTVSDKLLIDCCPSVVTQLQEQEVDPITIPVVCFTHMHCDHYMGLAPLLHYWRVCKNGDLSNLTLIGPKAMLEDIVEQTLRLLFQNRLEAIIKQRPVLIPIEGERTLSVPGFTVYSTDADHAVPGLCYRVKDEETGHSVGFTGDTRYLPSFGSFFQQVDLLLHEASFGGSVPNEQANAACRHSSAHEAVRVSKEADVKHLLLTHAFVEKREGALAVAEKELTIPVGWAIPGEVFVF